MGFKTYWTCDHCGKEETTEQAQLAKEFLPWLPCGWRQVYAQQGGKKSFACTKTCALALSVTMTGEIVITSPNNEDLHRKIMASRKGDGGLSPEEMKRWTDQT